MNAEVKEFHRLQSLRSNPQDSSTFVHTGVNPYEGATDEQLAVTAATNVSFRNGMICGVFIGFLIGAAIISGVIFAILKVKGIL